MSPYIGINISIAALFVKTFSYIYVYDANGSLIIILFLIYGIRLLPYLSKLWYSFIIRDGASKQIDIVSSSMRANLVMIDVKWLLKRLVVFTELAY